MSSGERINLTTSSDSKSSDFEIDSKHTGSEKVLGNILSLGTAEVAASAIGFLGISYLARRLGPEGFGIIGFAAAFFGYAGLAVTAGFDDVGAREIARRQSEATKVAATVILMRLVFAVVALLVLSTIVIWFFDKPRIVKQVVILMGLLLFPMALNTSWVYKGLERNRPAAVALILGQALYVLSIFLVVKNSQHVIFVPMAQFIGELAAALLLAVPLFWASGIRFDFRGGWIILHGSSIRTLTRVSRLLLFTFDVVFIGFVLGEKAVGLYTAPYRICLLLVAIAAAIHVSYLPSLTRALASNLKQVNLVMAGAVEVAAAIAFPVLVGGVVLATPLLVAVFGRDYSEGANAFRLLLLSVAFMFIHTASRNLLLVSNRLKLEFALIGAATFVNISLNLFVIPRYGLVGAAFTTALCEGLVLLGGVIIIYRLGVRLPWAISLRPIAAAGVMGISLLLLGTRGLILSILLGGLIYVVTLAAFRGFPQDLRPYLQEHGSSASGWRAKLNAAFLGFIAVRD